jgi:hypothetical protein
VAMQVRRGGGDEKDQIGKQKQRRGSGAGLLEDSERASCQARILTSAFAFRFVECF